MDDPRLDARRHIAALRGLAQINRVSRSVRIVWRPIAELAGVLAPAPLRILDVATGAGDIPIALCGAARSAGIAIELHACDINPRALEHARGRAAETGVDVRFFQLDALAGPPPETYDVVVCSLFLHHLSEPDAVRLLRHLRAAARRSLLVNDLRRCVFGELAARIVPHVLTRSDVIHTDAVLSAQAAYTIREARGLAEEAGLHGCRVERRWPARFLLRWDHS
jgi:2-polyprenyl-3-methyl-5-hydroxy-6-metoxy-1,4-benzoquinol methylase